jgi:hypothetical protein
MMMREAVGLFCELNKTYKQTEPRVSYAEDEIMISVISIPGRSEPLIFPFKELST